MEICEICLLPCSLQELLALSVLNFMNIFCQGDMFPLSEHILDMREECAFQPQFSRGHSDVTTSDPDSKMSYFFSVKAVVPKSVYTVLYFVVFCDTEVEHQQ